MSYQMQNYQHGVLATNEERQMGMFIHLADLVNVVAFPIGAVIAIVLWQTNKDKMPALDAHGKMAVNWVISSFIYAIVSIPLMFLLIGFLTLFGVFLLGIIFPIVGAVKANNGELWEYPLTIKFIK